MYSLEFFIGLIMIIRAAKFDDLEKIKELCVRNNLKVKKINKEVWRNFPNFNEPFVQVQNNKLNLSAQINPLKDLTIDLNAERNHSNNISENYRVEDQRYVSLNSNEYGNFGMSTILIKTAFSGGTGVVNKNFQKFRDNRLIIAKRLAQKNHGGGIS